MLNVSKQELFKDLEKAVEFDQSALFKKIYEEEYGQLGGQPYGMLVGDYEFGRNAEDISLLKMISGVAAAAHAPFVAAAGPKMFNFDSFTELANPRDLAKIFESVEYAAVEVVPRIGRLALRRPDHAARPGPAALRRELQAGQRVQLRGSGRRQGARQVPVDERGLGLRRRASPTPSPSDGWMARTRGVEGGGKVEGLPVHTFPTDDGDVAMKCPTEIAISDRREFELSNLGFLPLLHSKGNDFAVFMGAQSCQKPKTYFDPAANANAELSSKFNLLLCTSRFAHYLKVMARDKIGSFMEASECGVWLNSWISNYVVAQPGECGRSHQGQAAARRMLTSRSARSRESPGTTRPWPISGRTSSSRPSRPRCVWSPKSPRRDETLRPARIHRGGAVLPRCRIASSGHNPWSS